MTKSYVCVVFTIIYLLEMLIWLTETINVALSKSGSYCSSNKVIDDLFDNNFEQTLMIRELCKTNAFINVNLENEFSVQYLLVHQAEGNYDRQLDSFKVHLGSGPSMILCAEFATKAPPVNYEMRVNCRPSFSIFSEVRIDFFENKGLSLAEIEVHSLASGLPEVAYILGYRGCYKYFGAVNEINNFENCHRKCRNLEFVFAGIKNGKYCACGNMIFEMDILPAETCHLMCEGNKFCGGIHSYSVYVVNIPLPYFYGCFRTGINENHTFSKHSMTVKKCLQTCKHYPFAVLQNENWCTCLKEFPKSYVQFKSSDCSMYCTGEHFRYCGEVEKGSVYSTCRQSRGYMACSDFLQCEDSDAYNMFGSCGSRCKEGFTGEYCFELDENMIRGEKNLTTREMRLARHSFLDEYLKYLYVAVPILTLFFVLICRASGRATDERSY